jgi:polyhydroxyalkanoate synthase
MTRRAARRPADRTAAAPTRARGSRRSARAAPAAPASEQALATTLASAPSPHMPAATAAAAAQPARAGSREPGASPWLGGAPAPSKLFEALLALERRLTAWTPLPDTGVAPATTTGAFLDWWMHLAASPAKQWELGLTGLGLAAQAAGMLAGVRDGAAPLPQDKRFADPAWSLPPYRLWAQSFLLAERWWDVATRGVPGVDRHRAQMVAFGARQWLDMLSPSNFVSLNPVVQARTRQEGGLNLVRGAAHALEDAWRAATDQPPVGAEEWVVGRNLAITPGRVVLRTPLMELIQYAPATPAVHPEPVLLVPAWIMKYYILDLSPSNSMVRSLVERGHTVFAISWKNPRIEERGYGMADYDRLGVRAALDAIGRIVPGAKVQAVGYCLGGTLLATVAAALARDGDERLATLSLFAAQTDFSDPGELALFIDESQVAFLENLMARTGYLDKHQMASTFQMLRSNDLVWSYRLHSQLLGERRPMSDLMAWNADGTRLPERMHREYLHGFFLKNALAHGEWMVDGRPVNLHDLRVPVFNVGAVQDHVAPWRSVYKLHALTDAEQTFVLTAGGHNVGIVNPPGDARASYRIRTRRRGDRLLTADEWLAAREPVAGSWWTAWGEWLDQHSGARVAAPSMGAPAHGLPPLEAAPGGYVRER